MTQNIYERLTLGQGDCFVRADGTPIQIDLCIFRGSALICVPQDYSNGLPHALRNIPPGTTSYYIPPDFIPIDNGREISSLAVHYAIFFELPPIQSQSHPISPETL